MNFEVDFFPPGFLFLWPDRRRGAFHLSIGGEVFDVGGEGLGANFIHRPRVKKILCKEKLHF